MAYVEVRKGGELITQRRVDPVQARIGCGVRLGEAEPVRLSIGQSARVGEYAVSLHDGRPPGEVAAPEETALRARGRRARPDMDASSAGAAAGSCPVIEGYEIVGRLGEGRLGGAWRGVQRSTGREVALKLPPTGRFGTIEARRRFVREVRRAAELEHPNIARVCDPGEQSELCYYAAELVEGAAIHRYVERHRLNQGQILALMRTVCRALQHAHDRGVIHRNLKPSKVLVDAGGQPHVLDFGLTGAFRAGDAGVEISIEGEVDGTPAYMSPERAAGRLDEIDARTDVHALGTILFQLLTGASPHDLSGSDEEVMQGIAESEPRRPRDMTREVSRELATVLLKALARRAGDRYASAGDLADDLDRHLRGEPLAAHPATKPYLLRKWLRRNRARLLIALAAGLLILAAAAAARLIRDG